MLFIDMQKLIINTLKIMIKNKESSYLKYWDVNDLYGWAMSQKLLLDGFKWVEETSQFNEDFIKSYNEDSNIWLFTEADVQYPEKLRELHNDLPFFPERMKIEKVENPIASFHDGKEYVIHKRNLES